MVRRTRVRSEQRALSVRAYERWKARAATVPTAAERARNDLREGLRGLVESTAYRELRRATERQIGATLDFADLPPNEQALKAGRPVVRLVTLGGAGVVPEGFATGVLVAPDVLLTNHHVFRAADEADGVGAQFLYERTQGGVRAGVIFEFAPKRFFLNHKGLDYTCRSSPSRARSSRTTR